MLEKSLIELQQLTNLIDSTQQRGFFSELERDVILAKLREVYSSVLAEDISLNCTTNPAEPHTPKYIELELEPDLPVDNITEEIPPYFDSSVGSEQQKQTAEPKPSTNHEQPLDTELEANLEPLQGVEFSLDIEEIEQSAEPTCQQSLFEILSEEDQNLISYELCNSNKDEATRLIKELDNLKDFDLTILYIQEHFSGKSASKSVAKLVDSLSTKFI